MHSGAYFALGETSQSRRPVANLGLANGITGSNLTFVHFLRVGRQKGQWQQEKVSVQHVTRF